MTPVPLLNIFIPSFIHLLKFWWQRHDIIDYASSKFHGLTSKIDRVRVHPFIASKIANTQQSTHRIRNLRPLLHSSIEILVAAARYYRLCVIRILWPTIKHWRRYIDAFIYCSQNHPHTTISMSNSISLSPPSFIHQNFEGSGMILSTTRHSNFMA